MDTPDRKPAAAKKVPSVPAPGAGARKTHAVTRHVRKDDGTAFLPDPTEIGHGRVKDDLAEEFGEDFVSTITSGESVDDARDMPVPEEDGGPFVMSVGEKEYAEGTDASNPEDAMREPFPTTRGEPR